MADEGKWRLATAYKHQQRTDVPNGCLILPNVVDGVRILHILASLPWHPWLGERMMPTYSIAHSRGCNTRGKKHVGPT